MSLSTPSSPVIVPAVVNASQSNRVPPNATLCSSSRSRTVNSNVVGKPWTDMMGTNARMPVKVAAGFPATVPLILANTRLASLTLKPMALSVSRSVTLPSASVTKPPLTPTKRYTSDRLTFRIPAFCTVSVPSETSNGAPSVISFWMTISNCPEASTKPSAILRFSSPSSLKLAGSMSMSPAKTSSSPKLSASGCKSILVRQFNGAAPVPL